MTYKHRHWPAHTVVQMESVKCPSQRYTYLGEHWEGNMVPGCAEVLDLGFTAWLLLAELHTQRPNPIDQMARTSLKVQLCNKNAWRLRWLKIRERSSCGVGDTAVNVTSMQHNGGKNCLNHNEKRLWLWGRVPPVTMLMQTWNSGWW